MEKPPMEWIDKLFICMAQFYGTRWTKLFSNAGYEEIQKDMWQSGLQGLNYEQIKDTLVFFKREAKNASSFPPHHLEFYREAKRSEKPIHNNRGTIARGDPAIARHAMDEIKRKLRGGNPLETGRTFTGTPVLTNLLECDKT